MKTATILRLSLLGALATAARAWDFEDTLDSPVNATTVSGASTLGSGSSDNDEQRIYGGTEADASLYKYIVSLRKTPDGMTYCGGSLIAPQYVLTAAHCVKTTGTMYASIGSKYASGTADGERIAVAEAYVHPQYNKADHLYDVAILKLSTKSTITPVPLAAADGSDNKEKTMAVVRGWGLTETKVQASTLQEVNVRIITNAECNKQYNNRITDGMICAGEGGGKDSCQGDSGGPLVSNNKLIGVVSWGGDCGVAAGVYSRVSFILDFVNQKIGGGAATNATAAPAATPAPAATTVAPTAAPTPVVTTAAPTTAPVTEAPATSAPAPTTAAPAPTTAAPAPTTAAPAPTTAAPAPTTAAPAPTTAAPAPTTAAPTPTTTAPVTSAPTTPASASSGSKSDSKSNSKSDEAGSPMTPEVTPAPAATTVEPTVTPAAATTKPAATKSAPKVPGKVTCMVKPKPKSGADKSNGAASTTNNDVKQSDDY